jgi:LacI family transcriptional regulator
MSNEPNPRISLRDIAKALGVSHVTVSMALRDNPRVSEATRKNVKELAEKLGYRPDPMLVALSKYRQSKHNPTIHAAIAWVNAWEPAEQLRRYKEFDLYWQGASHAAEKHGYRLEEFRLDQRCNPTRLHEILSARGIRGILLPPHKQQPDWKAFPWGNYSVVRLGRSLQTPACHIVTADQAANTMLAFNEMTKRGYRRIGLVINELDSLRSGHMFEAGFLQAQRTVDETQRIPICAIDYSIDRHAPEKLAAWIRGHQVDVILTENAKILALLEKGGISVPKDVSVAVTTVHDTPIPAGIDQHPWEIGRVGFLTLNSLIIDGTFGVPEIFRQILVSGTWVDGDTMPDKRK